MLSDFTGTLNHTGQNSIIAHWHASDTISVFIFQRVGELNIRKSSDISMLVELFLLS
jgi:hypothetical protein